MSEIIENQHFYCTHSLSAFSTSSQRPQRPSRPAPDKKSVSSVSLTNSSSGLTTSGKPPPRPRTATPLLPPANPANLTANSLNQSGNNASPSVPSQNGEISDGGNSLNKIEENQEIEENQQEEIDEENIPPDATIEKLKEKYEKHQRQSRECVFFCNFQLFFSSFHQSLQDGRKSQEQIDQIARVFRKGNATEEELLELEKIVGNSTGELKEDEEDELEELLDCEL